MANFSYDAWMGKAVVLQVVLGDIKVPLRGKMMGDVGGAVRIRVGGGWDVNIYKTMIAAIEEDAPAFQAA